MQQIVCVLTKLCGLHPQKEEQGNVMKGQFKQLKSQMHFLNQFLPEIVPTFFSNPDSNLTMIQLTFSSPCTQVRRVQSYADTIDNLKARNFNVSSNAAINAVSVITKWEPFESGVGSLKPPTAIQSSTVITQEWEQFD